MTVLHQIKMNSRESVQKMLQEIQGELTKSYVAKRIQFSQDIKSTIEFMNKKLLCVFKTQQMKRRMLHDKYSQMVGPLFQQWERDVLKIQQEDRFVNAANQHAEILHKCAMAQKTTIDEAEKISDQFLKVCLL
ncbi:Synaptonemal complex protein 3 [Lemmus lemmus]